MSVTGLRSGHTNRSCACNNCVEPLMIAGPVTLNETGRLAELVATRVYGPAAPNVAVPGSSLKLMV